MRDRGALALDRLMDRHPDVDGVFVGSDNMAAGALNALKARGATVPGDVAVVGFDDLTIAGQTDPSLTTVHQPIRELGRAMAAMTVQLIAGQRPRPVVLPTHLVARGSAPAVRAPDHRR